MTKKNIIFLSISLVLIMLLGIGVSYSMWNVSVSQNINNTAYTECFDLSITNKENNISLNNAYPISNDKGKSLTPYTFTVTNTCDITAQYNINLEVLNNSTLSSKFIDVMLENNEIKEINLLSNFDNANKVNASSIESRKLTTGILKSQESKDYSLRLWLDYNTTLEDLNNEIKSFKSKIVVVGKPIKFNYDGDMVFNFDYTGSEQTFIAPVSGTYRLETWGAQGGSAYEYSGGYGGYSDGIINLSANNTVYINVGGSGTSNGTGAVGGYNGGGASNKNNSSPDISKQGSGGGATHISNKSGLLNILENSKFSILIVSGGGGGANYWPAWGEFKPQYGYGGSAGGFVGNTGTTVCPGYEDCHSPGTGGSQVAGGMSYGENIQSGFGIGGTGNSTHVGGAGGGGGFYGGGGSLDNAGGGGGSSYIGNTLLTDKAMYCYNCEESFEESTKTISTTCNEETPTSYCAKKGNGYARITLVSIDE